MCLSVQGLSLCIENLPVQAYSPCAGGASLYRVSLPAHSTGRLFVHRDGLSVEGLSQCSENLPVQADSPCAGRASLYRGGLPVQGVSLATVNKLIANAHY